MTVVYVSAHGKRMNWFKDCASVTVSLVPVILNTRVFIIIRIMKIQHDVHYITFDPPQQWIQFSVLRHVARQKAISQEPAWVQQR